MWKVFDRKRGTSALPSDLWQVELRSQAEFDTLWQANAGPFAQRRKLEGALAGALPAGKSAAVPGYCAVCAQNTRFVYDHQYAAAGEVNWRERLLCEHCGLNNRQRLALHLLSLRGTAQGTRIYVTEQTTPTATVLGKHYKHIVGSEYLGPDWRGGQRDARGLRHEDVTRLSFQPGQFDWVLTFDVLEHVPDYRSALKEFVRVTTADGRLMITVPQSLKSKQNIVRAELGSDGEIIHRLPPEYHGDPVNPDAGILCYYYFGWALLQDLKDAGFDDAAIVLSWSRGFGYMGVEQAVVIAVKSGSLSE